MKKLQRILVPIDFSAVAQNAVKHVNSLLEKHPAEVVLVYVNNPEKEMQEQEIMKIFRDFEVNTLQDVSFFYRFEIWHGNLLKELARASEKHEADLVIMGLKDRIPDLALTAELMRMKKRAEARKPALEAVFA